MATFTIKEIRLRKGSDDADKLIASADYWARRAREETELATKYAQYSRDHLNEAAKILGFKNVDELNVYVDKHGTI